VPFQAGIALSFHPSGSRQNQHRGRGWLPRPGLPRNVRPARRGGSDVRLGRAGLENPCKLAMTCRRGVH
jgi:hypothetical protein